MEQLQILEQLGAQFVTLGKPERGFQVEDIDGTYQAWFSDIKARYVVIRPDFYVASSASSADELRLQIEWLLHQLHLTPQLTGLEVEVAAV
ncbi:hypothetical protein P308_28570 [Pseudomonas piscis]|nr:hypothetical protein P308_28570 [Pseudomonas piscis]